MYWRHQSKDLTIQRLYKSSKRPTDTLRLKYKTVYGGGEEPFIYDIQTDAQY